MDKDFFFSSAGFTGPITPWYQHLLSSGDLNSPSDQSPECYFNCPLPPTMNNVESPYKSGSDGKLEESSVSDSRKRKLASKGKVVASESSAKRISKLEKGIGNRSFKMNQKDDDSTEAEKDYIHVRARRGQATDSHSLAERVRREKISERMKLLQDLVPGCNKVTGKALMLDEIISYVQQLQHNVEFLSMKLSSVSPTGLNFTKEPNYPSNSSTTLFGHQTQHANIPSGCWAVTQSSVDTTLCQNNINQSSLVLDEFGHGHLPRVPSFCENDLHNLVMSFGTRQTEQKIYKKENIMEHDHDEEPIDS